MVRAANRSIGWQSATRGKFVKSWLKRRTRLGARPSWRRRRSTCSAAARSPCRDASCSTSAARCLEAPRGTDRALAQEARRHASRTPKARCVGSRWYSPSSRSRTRSGGWSPGSRPTTARAVGD